LPLNEVAELPLRLHSRALGCIGIVGLVSKLHDGLHQSLAGILWRRLLRGRSVHIARFHGVAGRKAWQKMGAKAKQCFSEFTPGIARVKVHRPMVFRKS